MNMRALCSGKRFHSKVRYRRKPRQCCCVSSSASFRAHLRMTACRCKNSRSSQWGLESVALMNSPTPLKAIKWCTAFPAVTVKESIPIGNALPWREAHHNNLPRNSRANLRSSLAILADCSPCSYSRNSARLHLTH